MWGKSVRTRGVALTELVITLPLFILVIYGSLTLCNIGIVKLKAQEIAHYAAWAMAARPLSDFEDFHHAQKFRDAQGSVAEEVQGLYGDLDSASLAFSPQSIDNQRASLVPDFAEYTWTETLSPIGLVLNLIGIGTSTESMLAGSLARLSLNTTGQIRARADVRLGVILKDQGEPISVTLLADPWRIEEGYSAHPRVTTKALSHYANTVAEVSKNAILALPGGPLLSALLRLSGFVERLPSGVLVAVGVSASNPAAHTVSRPYIEHRIVTPPSVSTASGQINIFSETTAEIQENGAIRNFETGALFTKPNTESNYLKALNMRGENFMGCQESQRRGCFE